MRYVILRDDDTNALTPVECLERLYRPFLDRNLPVNLAVIPRRRPRTRSRRTEKRKDSYSRKTAEGGARWAASQTVPISDNPNLVKYLRENSNYHVIQHGCHHDCFEFNRKSPADIAARLDHGTKLLTAAGFPAPRHVCRAARQALARQLPRSRPAIPGHFQRLV